MSTPKLKSPDEIETLVASKKYQSLGAYLKSRLVTQATGASDELAQTLPVLLSLAGSKLESEFLLDLVATDAAAVAPKTALETPAPLAPVIAATVEGAK